MEFKKWKIDPALRFSQKYKVSPAVLRTVYRLRYSEIMGKKRDKLMPYKMIAEIAREKFHLNISKRMVYYWIKQCGEYRDYFKS